MPITNYKVLQGDVSATGLPTVTIDSVKPITISSTKVLELVIQLSANGDLVSVPTGNPLGSVRIYTAWEKDGHYSLVSTLNDALDLLSPLGDNAVLDYAVTLKDLPGNFAKALYERTSGGVSTDVMSVYLVPKLIRG